jgi:choline dehydrogenase-like flavoprotein
MYVRGDTIDYDDWERLGNKGWGFKELLPYFKKHETFDDPKEYATKSNLPLETKFDPEYHGHSGPIHTSFNTWRLPLEKEVRENLPLTYTLLTDADYPFRLVD